MSFEPLNPPHLPFKRCPQCGITFPRTTEFFGMRKGKRTLQPKSACRSCADKATIRSRANARLLGPILDPAKKRSGGRPATPEGDPKKCPDCDTTFPYTSEHFYKKDYRCKACSDKAVFASRSKHWEPEHLEKTLARKERKQLKAIGQLRCKSCKQIKAVDEFAKESRKWRGICYICSGKTKPETLPDGYRKCGTCKSVLPMERFSFTRKGVRGYRCKPCASKYACEYIKARPDKARVFNTRRQARKRALPDQFTQDDWQRAFDYFGGRCAVCERQLNDLFGTHKAAADHWTPLNSPDCPGTIPTNIIPLCHGQGGCNNSKCDRDAREWLIETRGKRQAEKIIARIEGYFDYIKGLAR